MLSKSCGRVKIIKPNFLFIGPDKTGSSWLYYILRQHPSCFVPAAKDIWYFDKYYYRGKDWYHSFFKDAPEEAEAIGEISHNYLFSSNAAKRIANDLPRVKLLTCLRNPVERTFSQYLYLRRSGITKLPLRDAIEAYPRLISNSLYYKHLSVYFDYFPRGQIKVLWFTDLKKDPERFAKEIFRFLGVYYASDINYNRQVRPAGEPRSYYLAKVLKWSGLVLRHLGLLNIVGYVKNSSLVNSIFYRTYKNSEKPKIDEKMEENLHKEFIRDIHSLEELLEVDLSLWLRIRCKHSDIDENSIEK